MGYCNKCGKSIPFKEYKFSMNKYKIPYCREHQPNNSSSIPIIKNNINPKKSSKINKPTLETKKLGNMLSEMGWVVEFEKNDGYKHIDIVIEKAKVNLEIDGIQHNVNTNQALADLQRTYHSFKKGFLTLRIPNCLVRDDNTIYKTAHFVHNFLNKSVETLDEEIEESENNGNFFENLMDKISNIQIIHK